MAKLCPETNSYVLYLDCLECDTKSCMKEKEKDEKEERRKKKEEIILNKNTLPNRNNVI